MAELKTQPTDESVTKFIEAIESAGKREDSKKLVKLMADVTGENPRMWGTSIIGFGSYQYKYESGREGEWFKIGFSPRKQNLTLYLMAGFRGYEQLLSQLGKHSIGKSCLYLKHLNDVDEKVLTRLIAESVAQIERAEK